MIINFTVVLLMISLVFNAILGYREYSNYRNRTVTPPVQEEENAYMYGLYDVKEFKRRIEEVKQEVELVDGVPLYTPVNISSEELSMSGVEVISDDLELLFEKRMRG